MANFWHSEFFQTILVHKDWKKFGSVKIDDSKFFQTSLVQKYWNKSGTAKIEYFKYF